MAILLFYINEEKGSQLDVKLEKHKGEKETDLSYLWGRYAMEKAVALNFENIFINPYTEDQGAKIHFLTGKILERNKLNEYGYPLENEDFSDYASEELDAAFAEHRVTFDPSSKEEATETIMENDNYVEIMLDLHQACHFIGGLNTPTAISSSLVYHAVKEHAKEREEAFHEF